MRRRRVRRFWQAGAWALVPLAAASWAGAQAPIAPYAPAVSVGPRYGYAGTKTCKDTFIGVPNLFSEPPPGFYLNEHLAMMQAKADPHRFTLYRTDFLPGTTRFSPSGATRFNLMATRLPRWLGPIVIEWSPELPGLAESRRDTVLATLRGAGIAMVPERIVIGPSPYPGSLGTDAANTYNTMIVRDQAAGAGYTLSPSSASTFSSGGAGP